MRVWDIHPGYLSRQSLLGQHAEIHAIYNIIKENKKGYSFHPETLRWKGRLARLKYRHDLTVMEMGLRSLGHRSPMNEEKTCPNLSGFVYIDQPAEQFAILEKKYASLPLAGRIPLAGRGSDFFSHHKYSIMVRGLKRYNEILSFLGEKEDLPISQEGDLIQRVLAILEAPVDKLVLPELTNRLWSYVKNQADSDEQNFYEMNCEKDAHSLLNFMFSLAVKYNETCLLHSTVFADLLQ